MDNLNKLCIQAEKFFSAVPGEKISFATDLSEALRRFSPEKTIVFSGMHYAQTAGDAGFRVWCGIDAEPDSKCVEAMAEYLHRQDFEQVLAIGGGSVLDAAKAALLMVETHWPLDKLFGVNLWSNAHPGKSLRRIIAIPTTSGTGSESTPYSNIVVRAAGVKRLIVEKESIPAEAVMIPELTATMPELLTRATGCDALAHLIEGFINVRADGNHPSANQWAKCGIAMVAASLPGAMKNIPEARKAMMYAALLGGMTIRYKSTGLPHLCSFSWFGRIAHGDAVAVLLPECWRYYLANPLVRERTMELQDIFPGTTPEEVIASYEEFLDSVGMPGGLSAWPGINAALIEKTAASGAQNRMKLELAPHPVPLEDSCDILTAILKLSL